MLISKLRANAQVELDALCESIRAEADEKANASVVELEKQMDADLAVIQDERDTIKAGKQSNEHKLRRLEKNDKRRIRVESKFENLICNAKDHALNDGERQIHRIMNNYPDADPQGLEIRQRLRYLRKLNKAVCNDTMELAKAIPELKLLLEELDQIGGETNG